MESSSLLTISCADHNHYLAFALRNLFDSKMGTDFELSLGGKSARAHKIIVELFLASETIEVVEKGRRVPQVKQEESDIENPNGWNCLESILEFLYKGEVALPKEKLKELLLVARKLEFTMLVDAIAISFGSKVIENVDALDVKVENAKDFLGVSIGNNTSCCENVGAEDVFGIVDENFTSFSAKSEEFHNLCGTETESVTNWLENNDKPSETEHIDNLGRRIRACSPHEEQTSSPKVWNQQTCLDCTDHSDGQDSDPQSSNSLPLQFYAIKIKSELEGIPVALHSEFCGSSPREVASRPAVLKPMQYSDNLGDYDNEAEESSVDDLSQASGSLDSYVAELRSGHDDDSDASGGREFNRRTDDRDYHCDLVANQGTASYEKSYKCSHCDFETDKYENYGCHLKAVHQTSSSESAPKYKCAHCQFEAPNYGTYYRHLHRVHKLTVQGEPVEKQKCPECDYTSATLAQLNVHHFAKHSKERPFPCEYCSFAGKRHFQLVRHLTVVHGLGDSRFLCQTCGQRCASRASLEHHTRIHTNDRQYKCPHCCYASIRKYCLRNHMLAVHSKDVV